MCIVCECTYPGESFVDCHLCHQQAHEGPHVYCVVLRYELMCGYASLGLVGSSTQEELSFNPWSNPSHPAPFAICRNCVLSEL